MSQFEHLELPKTSIEFPRRKHGGGGGGSKRSDRSDHGYKLLDQVSALSQRTKTKASSFCLDPKLIFKVKLAQNGNLAEKDLSPLGLVLLAQEPKAKKAIVVFASDRNLQDFRSRLENYSGIKTDYEYGYLDAVEDLVPLEPEDRIGRLLQLEPVQIGELAALDVDFWHTGDKAEMEKVVKTIDQVLRTWHENSPMQVSDYYIGEYLCRARIRVTDDVLSLLLDEEFVKEIDRRPKPNFETSAEFASVTLSDLPEVLSPPETAQGVLVIDSGVQRGHPLIAPALGEAEVFPDPDQSFITGGSDDGDEKTGGHGTGVASIAIYGDVIGCVKAKKFEPTVWLFSARVTNQNNDYDPDILLENQLGQAIQYFIENYPNCKVINISLGDSRLVLEDGQKQFRIASRIDEIAYKLRHKDIVFVISAGNFHYKPTESNEQFLTDYPNYLLRNEARIIEPATSAIALTVGSLSFGTGSSKYSEDAKQNPVAKLTGYPSPFTRTGPGIDGMIKPDLVDFGGDFVIQGDRVIENEPGVAVLTLAKKYSSSLFRAYCGTSFSAPKVANIAAQLFTHFPQASSNLIRALIVNSALLPIEIPSALQGDTKQSSLNRLRVYGYGQPDLLRTKYSAENYVVLIADKVEIPVGCFQIYEIPQLPDTFLGTPGKRILSIALAFDPPTRDSRGDSYLGVTMEFNLFKNIDPQRLTEAFKRATTQTTGEDFTNISLTDLKQKHGSGIIVKLHPGTKLRKKGTLQRGQIELSSRPTGYDKGPLYLVLSCGRKWAKEGEYDTQRYALVASISHSDPTVDVYNRLRAQINQRLRIR